MLTKKIFNPVCGTIVNITAYSLLGVILSLELNKSVYLTAGIFLSVMLLFLHILYLRRFESITKNQHIAFLVISISALLLMLIHFALVIKRSDYTLPILFLASFSPFYNFCGYTRFTKVDENTSVLKYIFGIMLIPFTAFLIYNHYAGTNYKTIYVIVIVAAYYFVIFSLIKMTALVIKEKGLLKNFYKTAKSRKVITVFLGIIMPVTGLLLNQYMYSHTSQYAKQTGYTYMTNNYGLFGDFSHPLFYLLILINGISLLISLSGNQGALTDESSKTGVGFKGEKTVNPYNPHESYKNNKKIFGAKYNYQELALFYARSFGYSFVIYMFIVFLPVIPVGILTLLFIIGIYAFIPLLLAWWQGKILIDDYKRIKNEQSKKAAISIFILGFLTLPIIVASVFVYDKINFNKAIIYIDQNNTDASEKIDIKALKRTINSRDFYTRKTRLYGSSIKAYYSYKNIPIISSAYNRYIFGGQNLDWKYQRMLEGIFFNDGYYDYYNSDYAFDLSILDYYNREKNSVLISDVQVTTNYDESINAYRTWVDLSLYNPVNAVNFNNEYKTLFYLPDGVFISDYYLYVGKEKKMGLLTDQRAALSIYKKIVLSSLDPGILHYVTDNLLELRVFPFLPDEERKTGFELIHKNKFTLKIDNYEIDIEGGDSLCELNLPNVVLLSANEIKKLPPIKKEFDYNFILDCSDGSDTEGLSQLIRNYCIIHGVENGTVYFTGYRFEKYPVKDINKIDIKKEGGFNLNLAVRDIIKNSGTDKIPIIIYVTDNEDNKIIKPKQINNYNSPESEFYYQLDYNMNLTPYSLYTGYSFDKVYKPIINSVVSYNGHTVINDGMDKLIILNETEQDYINNQYLDAMLLAAQNKINLKNGVKNPVSYIRKSFLSHVLTPSTAFIVVETPEQEEELMKLQEQILNEQEIKGAKNLSEPHMVILGLLLLTVFGLVKFIEFYGNKRFTFINNKIN